MKTGCGRHKHGLCLHGHVMSKHVSGRRWHVSMCIGLVMVLSLMGLAVGGPTLDVALSSANANFTLTLTFSGYSQLELELGRCVSLGITASPNTRALNSSAMVACGYALLNTGSAVVLNGSIGVYSRTTNQRVHLFVGTLALSTPLNSTAMLTTVEVLEVASASVQVTAALPASLSACDQSVNGSAFAITVGSSVCLRMRLLVPKGIVLGYRQVTAASLRRSDTGAVVGDLLQSVANVVDTISTDASLVLWVAVGSVPCAQCDIRVSVSLYASVNSKRREAGLITGGESDGAVTATAGGNFSNALVYKSHGVLAASVTGGSADGGDGGGGLSRDAAVGIAAGVAGCVAVASACSVACVIVRRRRRMAAGGGRGDHVLPAVKIGAGVVYSGVLITPHGSRRSTLDVVNTYAGVGGEEDDSACDYLGDPQHSPVNV